MRRFTTAALLTAALLALPAAASAQFPGGVGDVAWPWPKVAHNPANALLRYPLEAFAYDNATHCRKHPMSGTVALERWLTAHWRGESWGIMRCERLSKHNYSLHAEGRALDWHLNAWNRVDRHAALKLIHLLLAPDRNGEPGALARRMGVEEIIWDCGYWGAGAAHFSQYWACWKHGKRLKHPDPTLAHRNHVHLGLTKNGAKRTTSFWRHGAPAP